MKTDSLNTILAFTPHRNYESEKEYVGEKIKNSMRKNKFHSKCDCVDWSTLKRTGGLAHFRFK